MSRRFTATIADWVDRTTEQLDAVAKIAALEVHSGLVAMTPVGNPDLWAANQGKKRGDPGYVGKGYVGGTLKNNWQITVGAPATVKRERVDGKFPESTNDFNLPSYTTGATIYIVNLMEYARVVDSGTSTQAPAGMTSVTIARWDDIVKAAVATARALR